MTTSKRPQHAMLIAALVALLAALPAFGADGDKATVRGMITSIQGNTITVKDANNVERTIMVSSGTRYKKTKGLTGAINEKVEQSSLMPGLPIIADGVTHGSSLEATAICYKMTSRPRSRCRTAWRRRASAWTSSGRTKRWRRWKCCSPRARRRFPRRARPT